MSADQAVARFARGRWVWRLADLRGAARPLLWLALGLVAVQVFLNAAMLSIRGGPALPPPMPLFVPQAVVLSSLLLTPRRYWWLLLVESYAIRMAEGVWLTGLPFWFVVLSNVANLLEPLTGALLLSRLIRLPPRFGQLREVSLYAACVIVASIVGATWGTASRVMGGADLWLSWRGWFLSDVLASLLLAPTIILWVRARHGGRGLPSRPRLREAALLCAGLVLAGVLVFGPTVVGPETTPALLYLLVPLLLWAAVRFGPLGLTSALAVVTAFAVAGVANGLGPFVERSRAAGLFDVQMFLFGIGVPLLVLAALVHERQRAQSGLERSEARYRVVVSNFPRSAVLLFDGNLRHLFADGRGLPEIGLSRDAVEGRTPCEAFPAPMAAALEPAYRAALAGGHSSFDLTHAGRVYQAHVQSLSDAGTATGMAVLQDVTEQRRAAELAELDRAKTAFFGNVSHELRTPLTLLLAPLEELLAAPPPGLGPAERELLEIAHRNGLRLLRLVNTLLDFARLEAGRLRATFVPTDLAAWTAELAGVFRSAVEHAGLRLVVDCPPLPEPVHVDREHWEHVVFNLLSNALKFTFEGEIAVTLRARDGRAVLTVRDTGTGIAAEELPRLFDRFHRVRDARARTHEGTGIGLALVQELVRLHGGTAEVASTPGGGSTFTVSLPFGAAHLPSDRVGSPSGPARPSSAAAYVEEVWRWLPAAAGPAVGDPAADAAPVVPELAPSASSAADRPARLLVADDNADMRAYLARLLGGRGAVKAVGDGAAALEVARSWEPDLILADVMMPGLNGLALLRAVRADPRLRAVSVLLLSARAGEEARVEALRAGADAYLVKPFAAAELLARVDGQLGLVHLRGEAWAAAERRRLARELHDSVTQALFSANLIADVLPRTWELDPDEAREALTELRRLTASALAEMRTLLLELRPDALVRAPLHEVLGTFVTAASAWTRAVVDARLDPVPALPPAVQLALYRIAQEAFTNSARHAGATRIAVRLHAGPAAPAAEPTDDGRADAVRPGDGPSAEPAPSAAGTLALEVVDDGQGFDSTQTSRGRLGLASMRERADSVGATLLLRSRPGEGTAVVVTWRGTGGVRPAPGSSADASRSGDGSPGAGDAPGGTARPRPVRTAPADHRRPEPAAEPTVGPGDGAGAG